MKKIFLLLSILILLPFYSASAQSTSSTIKSGPINTSLIKDAAGGAGLKTSGNSGESIAATVGTIISIMLSFVGTIFFIIIIYAGIQWMTAGGNEEKVTKARTRIVQASIGLAITVAAYFITWFIGNALGVA